MPSGWDVYYVVFMSAALALGIPLVLSVLSRLFAPAAPPSRRIPSAEIPAPEARPFLPGKRVNVRFFLATNAALVLIALMLTIVPGVGALHANASRSEVLRTLLLIVSVAGFAAIGLLYSARKGDLSWLLSYQKDEKDGGSAP